MYVFYVLLKVNRGGGRGGEGAAVNKETSCQDENEEEKQQCEVDKIKNKFYIHYIYIYRFSRSSKYSAGGNRGDYS